MFLSFQGHSLEAQPKTAGEFHLLGWIWGGRILNVKYVNIELGIAFNAWNMSASIIRLRQHMWLILGPNARTFCHHLPFILQDLVKCVPLLTAKNRLLIRGPQKIWYARRVNYVKGGFLQADVFRTECFARKMICSWPCPSSWNAFASNTTRPRTPSRRSTTRSPRMAKRSPVTKRIGKFPIPPLKPELFIQCSFHIESVTWTYLEHSTIGDGTPGRPGGKFSYSFFFVFLLPISPIIMGSVGKWAPTWKGNA